MILEQIVLGLFLMTDMIPRVLQFSSEGRTGH